MKIYRNLEDFIPLDNAVVTIGTFDGVHVGHQKILSTLKECARNSGGETVLLTFFPHPRMILHPEDDSLRLISDIEEKVALLADAGIDHLIITPFTRDFSNQSPEAYIRDVLVGKIGTKKIIIGYDHRFGKDRSGSLKDLLDHAEIYGYTVEQIPEQDINDVAVSSTKIREALIKGDIATANSYLGHPFQLTGKVVRGNQLGRNIGYPTANLQVLENHKLIPAYGIYAVEAAVIDLAGITTGTYQPNIPEHVVKGMGYIGTRPTIDGISRSIEVHLFDFHSDIYGKTLQVNFLHFIRHDQWFENMQEMIDQMAKDERKIRDLFGI
ncbi:bifunctional riboflavin kinase/FAD synthetase [Parapedobacter indicus]|uniref:Riboflavin biosynthesis protein n=1 Tax=Parapedobacter indicus TaxID=1477437 RepID=A0A1I3RU13_9SPHI|nr:bifunctional riboflavin kinase/FAD synthetase [Parapedobacter indicus]PPK99995.1 riboflavin kinase/FMN adenylyltransferase [Parapedobacter indicus]SFJ49382.1 riboflavin kinase / FMN adenylyltransferase [Parapedobacter indicus]